MIKISKIIHRNQERIKVDFPYNQSIASQIKKIADAKWSQTHRAWHIPYTKEAYRTLKELFPNSSFQKEEKELKIKEIDNQEEKKENNQYLVKKDDSKLKNQVTIYQNSKPKIVKNTDKNSKNTIKNQSAIFYKKKVKFM